MASPPVYNGWMRSFRFARSSMRLLKAVFTLCLALAEPVAAQDVGDNVLLAWTSSRLHPNLAEGARGLAGVTLVTVVHSGLAHLVRAQDSYHNVAGAAPEGFVLPLEIMVLDAATYLAFVPAESAGDFTSLAANEALLGTTSSQLRGVGAGARLELADGTALTVRAVVADHLIGGGEIAVVRSNWSAAAAPRARYLLLRYRGARSEIENGIRALLPADVPVRLRAPGETPILRHGDAVLPQAQIKARFGEFAYRPADGRNFERDPAWAARNLVTAQVPLIGTVTCHRLLVPALTGAMQDVADQGLGFLIDRDGFAGCAKARMIASGSGISRHAWGAAVDLNFGNNPQARIDARDPRLVAIMARWGFASGHTWLVPDAGHFEYYRMMPAR